MGVAQALLSPSMETAVVRLFASIFISSLAAMLSWRNRCIHNVRFLQARLFASHGDKPGRVARPERLRETSGSLPQLAPQMVQADRVQSHS